MAGLEYLRDGQWMGEGFIQASGGSLKFKEFGNGQENDIATEFSPMETSEAFIKSLLDFLNWDFETQGRAVLGTSLAGGKRPRTKRGSKPTAITFRFKRFISFI